MGADVERLHGLTDLVTPMAIRVAATLRLADRIAAGTTMVTELATDVEADPDALGRLLRYLAARGVFAELEPGRFALTECAEALRDDHPDQIRAWLDLTRTGRPSRTWIWACWSTSEVGNAPSRSSRRSPTPQG